MGVSQWHAAMDGSEHLGHSKFRSLAGKGDKWRAGACAVSTGATGFAAEGGHWLLPRTGRCGAGDQPKSMGFNIINLGTRTVSRGDYWSRRIRA